jgi:hypothetical protein
LTQVDVAVHVRSGYADAEVYHPRYGWKGHFMPVLRCPGRVLVGPDLSSRALDTPSLGTI